MNEPPRRHDITIRVAKQAGRDTEAVARISERLTVLGRGEADADLATVRQDLARRRATGA